MGSLLKMAFTKADLKAYSFPESRQAYTARDTMLYALGLGIGSDPTDPMQLQFVYERNLVAVPTMAVVLAHPGFWAGDPALGIDWTRMLHVGQGLTLHQTVSVAGEVIGRGRITDIVDRGREKGALLYYERDVIDAATGLLIATVRQTLLCRGNGGIETDVAAAPKPHSMPERMPDHEADVATLPQAALIYRLSGDLNPLHADPAVAAKAGFPRPILHGLATFGIAGHALLRIIADENGSRLRAFDARFSAPVLPGETIRLRFWQDAETVSLQAIAVDRGVVVLDGGRAVIAR